MKTLLIAGFVYLGCSCTVQGQPFITGKTGFTEAREMFFTAGSQHCKAEALIKLTETDKSGSMVIHAYYGAGYTILADCVKIPWKKLKYFNQGKQIIEEAVINEPQTPEIRFIRFMVQDKAPGFLDYDDREKDLPLLIRFLQKSSAEGFQDDFLIRMAEAINTSGFPDENQKEMLIKFLNQK